MTMARLDLREALRWSRPPALAWLAATLLTWMVARASDVAYWTAAGRERWDSVHYLSISRSGYEMFNCWDRPGYAEAGFRDVICGNVAWFPGYPMVVRIFSATGLSYDVTVQHQDGTTTKVVVDGATGQIVSTTVDGDGN